MQVSLKQNTFLPDFKNFTAQNFYVCPQNIVKFHKNLYTGLRTHLGKYTNRKGTFVPKKNIK